MQDLRRCPNTEALQVVYGHYKSTMEGFPRERLEVMYKDDRESIALMCRDGYFSIGRDGLIPGPKALPYLPDRQELRNDIRRLSDEIKSIYERNTLAGLAPRDYSLDEIGAGIGFPVERSRPAYYLGLAHTSGWYSSLAQERPSPAFTPTPDVLQWSPLHQLDRATAQGKEERAICDVAHEALKNALNKLRDAIQAKNVEMENRGLSISTIAVDAVVTVEQAVLDDLVLNIGMGLKKTIPGADDLEAVTKYGEYLCDSLIYDYGAVAGDILTSEAQRCTLRDAEVHTRRIRLSGSIGGALAGVSEQLRIALRETPPPPSPTKEARLGTIKDGVVVSGHGSLSDVLARLNPLTLLREAKEAVPALKYALGVVGLVSVIAIVGLLGIDLRVAGIGSIAVIVLMALLLVFAKLTKIAKGHFIVPALILMWASMILCILSISLLCTSVFFSWPVSLQHWLKPESVRHASPDHSEVTLQILRSESWKLPPDRLYRTLTFEVRALNLSDLSVPMDPTGVLVVSGDDGNFRQELSLEVSSSKALSRGAMLEPKIPESLFLEGKFANNYLALLDKEYSAVIMMYYDKSLTEKEHWYLTPFFTFDRNTITFKGD